MNVDPTFEVLRATLDDLAQPVELGARNTYWVCSRKLGVARTSDGSFEILLAGPVIHPRTATVRRHLEFGRWVISETDEQLDASRVVLPPAPHFVAIAALIAIELVRAGIGSGRDLQDTFDDVEPIIEMALRRGALSEEHVVGLIGELLCLEMMLDAVALSPGLRMLVLDMWQGHQVGRRDFVVGEASIEVKTTQQEASSHKITGLHQIEIEDTPESAEKRLYLLSIGLTPSEHEGQTLPEIVQRILDRLADAQLPSGEPTPLQARFLDDLARFGAGSGRGYVHRAMSGWKVYETRFRTTFTPRLYDMLDTDIRVLHRRDVAGTHVSPDDIQFRMDLPATVNGTNPAPSWQHGVMSLVLDVIE